MFVLIVAEPFMGSDGESEPVNGSTTILIGSNRIPGRHKGFGYVNITNNADWIPASGEWKINVSNS